VEGYILTVRHNTVSPEHCATTTSAPTQVDDVDAGLYEVTVTGRHLHLIRKEFLVRPGQRTDLVLRVQNARWASTMENAAKGAGQVLYDAGLGIVCVAGGAFAVFAGAFEDDDDPGPRTWDPGEPRRPVEQKPVFAGRVGKYRAKN